MRKLIVAEFVSVDGYVAGPNGQMDWGPASIDPDDLKPEWDTILLGRVTYELWARTWPGTPEGVHSQADFINKAPKVVFSTTLDAAPWGSWKSARLVKGAIPETIKEMKAQPGGAMAILGSAKLVQSFADLELIDEYLLIVFPVLLGGGKALFANGANRHMLKLVETRSVAGGAVTLRYRVAEGVD